MEKNLSNSDRYIRFLLGAAFLLNIVTLNTGIIGVIILLALAFSMLYSSYSGYCLGYTFIGISTSGSSAAIEGGDAEIVQETAFKEEPPAEVEKQKVESIEEAPAVPVEKAEADNQDGLNINFALDKKYENLTLGELIDAPVDALQGLSGNDAKLLLEAFNVKTIKDLANLKYAQWAQSIVDLSEAEE